MAERYRALNGKYLADAERLLAAGDYPQASEKFWGAVAQSLKLIAAGRHWSHSSHRDLVRVVHRLLQETGDRELPTLFSAAQSLHANFYENFAPPDIVAAWAEAARRLVEKLHGIAPPEDAGHGNTA